MGGGDGSNVRPLAGATVGAPYASASTPLVH